MDTGRLILAIALTIAVVLLTQLLFPPRPPEPEAPPEVVDVEPDRPVVPPDPGVEPPVEPPAEPPVEPPAEPPAPVAVADDTVAIRSALYDFGFSTRGGQLARAELLRFESFTRPDQPVDLVEPDLGPLLGYILRTTDRQIDLRRLPASIEPAEGIAFAPGDTAAVLSVRVQDPETGTALVLDYRFRPDQYLIDVAGRVEGLSFADRPRLLIALGPTLAVNEADPREDHRALSYVVNRRQVGIQSVRLDAVRDDRIEEGPLVWFAVKNKYFVAAGLSVADGPGGDFGGLIARPIPEPNAADLTATLPVSRDLTFAYQLYVGPQEYERMTAVGRRFEDLNPYGWRVFRPIIQPLAHFVTLALVYMQRFLDLGYGWVLLVFGVLIRLLMWPLNARAMRSQLKTMALQPRIKEIQEKYKEEPEKLQKEMFRLYREEGFNPLGGCLPMLVPMPVLITLFFVFQGTIEFRGVEFLWLPDLSRPDPFYILPLFLGGSMFLIQWLSARSMPEQTAQVKMMMWILPIVMVVIFVNLASGLVLYYAAFNVATLPQQFQLMKERQRMTQATVRREAAD